MKQLLLNKVFVFSALITAFLSLHMPQLYGQISVSPAFPTPADNITVYYDATQGNGGLNNTSPVHIHTGLITSASTSASDWKFVKYPWATNAADNVLTSLGDNLHSIALAPSVTGYYNPTSGTVIQKLAMVFRNASGSQVGKTGDNGDIFYDMWDGTTTSTKIVLPFRPNMNVPVGTTVTFRGEGSVNLNLSLLLNGTSVANIANSKVLTHSFTATQPGVNTFQLLANNGSSSFPRKTFSFTVSPVVTVENPPANLKLGPNENGDGTVTFIFRAPGKNFVYLKGSFNNFTANNASLMKRSTDGNTFWLTLPLTASTQHLYQYSVDGSLTVADPVSTLILDPQNDQYINQNTTVFPNIPAYPAGASGFVSVFRTNKPAFNWQVPIFNRPRREDLVIYELHLRDFVFKHSFAALVDTFAHLKSLGINAVELMPINEFEGNESWGYNPIFHMALDKNYGTENDLKRFIDLCHQNGIAVIQDVVFNHAFGQAPHVQMYFEGSPVNKPFATSPWMNRDATHPFNVGYDYNHSSNWTVEYVDQCLKYWQDEFKFDGFRFDLSKGFTQRNSGSDVGAWNVYDQSRVDILQHYYTTIQSNSNFSYVILEHLGGDDEEFELANRGFMMWNKVHDNYKQAAQGWSSNNGLERASAYGRSGWGSDKLDNLIAYYESHDEERLPYEMLNNGNSVPGGYSVRTLQNTTQRMELVSAFLYTVPGPKMLWQFGEFAYDYNIDFNGRVGSKPIRWDYKNNNYRARLYKVMGNIISLRTRYPEVFRTPNHNQNDLGNGFLKHFHLSPTPFTGGAVTENGPNQVFDVTIIGNFDVVPQTINPYFQSTGTWYDYLSGLSWTASNSVYLQPGEFHILTKVPLPEPPLGYTPFGVLPIELTFFKGKAAGNTAILNWETAQEQNNAGFWLQRSLDGKNFSDLRFVKGFGTTLTRQNYGYTDENLTKGNYYYRLRQQDFDGTESLSKTIAVQIDADDVKIGVFPNPTSGKVFLKNTTTELLFEPATLVDNLGRTVRQFDVLPNEIDLSELPKGVYILKIKGAHHKILKQ
jgi:1,4-alpha-glucan branching enzyme